MSLRTAHATAQQATKSVWLTVYSDIMTNLMLFFLILYASTRFSAERASMVVDEIGRAHV